MRVEFCQATVSSVVETTYFGVLLMKPANGSLFEGGPVTCPLLVSYPPQQNSVRLRDHGTHFDA